MSFKEQGVNCQPILESNRGHLVYCRYQCNVPTRQSGLWSWSDMVIDFYISWTRCYHQNDVRNFTFNVFFLSNSALLNVLVALNVSTPFPHKLLEICLDVHVFSVVCMRISCCWFLLITIALN